MHVIDSRILSNNFLEEYVVRSTSASHVEVDNDCIKIYTYTGYFIFIDGDAFRQIKEKLAIK